MWRSFWTVPGRAPGRAAAGTPPGWPAPGCTAPGCGRRPGPRPPRSGLADSSRVRLRPAMTSAGRTVGQLGRRVVHPHLDRGGDPAAGAEHGHGQRAAVGLQLPAGHREPAEPGHRERPAEPVRRGQRERRVRRQPAAEEHVDQRRRGEREQRLAHGGGVRGQRRVLRERRDGPAAARLLDVGHVALAQHAEPHVGVEGLRQVLQHEAGALLEAERRAARAADQPQRQPDAVVAVVGAFEDLPGGQLADEAVRGREGETGGGGDLGQCVHVAVEIGHQDHRGLADDRPARGRDVLRHVVLSIATQ